MSEEEKEAIEYTKLDIKITKEQLENGDLFMSEKQERERINNLKIILNLIEKQQKELNQEKEKNKELEKQNQAQQKQLNDAFDRGFIHKDKIREIFDNYSQSSLMENNTFLEFKKELLEERN